MTSEDAILGGRLRIAQPKRGHRVGHDTILLAAATPGRRGEHAVDLGAGVGAAGLALARRVAGLSVTLIEMDAGLAALAARNAERNGLSSRVRAIALDVGAPARAFTAVDLGPQSVMRVLMNPPFNDAMRRHASPDGGRQRAHVASPELLTQWVARARWLLAPKGSVTLIWRADGLGDVLAALVRGFGGVAVQAVYPKPGSAAIRVLVRAIKASRAPLALLPGLILNDESGCPTAEAEAIVRDGAILPLARL